MGARVLTGGARREVLGVLALRGLGNREAKYQCLAHTRKVDILAWYSCQLVRWLLVKQIHNFLFELLESMGDTAT